MFTPNESGMTGLIAAVSGVLSVIYVAKGKISNYLFGFINSVYYFIVSMQVGFRGEAITTVYFFIMQFVGIYMWRKQGKEKIENEKKGVIEKVKTDTQFKKLSFKGWIKSILAFVGIWLTFGFIYKNALGQNNRPFRDSVTDGTNWLGQWLMSKSYAEQWFWWIVTNLFSLYLWAGQDLSMITMYIAFTINSFIGWYAWVKNAKKAVVQEK